MFNVVKLQNFKAFTDSGDIPFRPITLILGPNSSGKSSILQSLAMLKQTLESRDLSSQLITDGELVSLGSYRDIVFAHDVTKKMALSFSYAISSGVNSNPGRSTALLRRYLHPSLTRDLNIQEVLVEVEFVAQSRNQRIRPEVTRIATAPDVIEMTREFKNSDRYQVRINVPSMGLALSGEAERPSKFHEVIPDVSTIRRRASLEINGGLESIWNPEMRSRKGLSIELELRIIDWLRMVATRIGRETERQFKSLLYLGPIREMPDRFYYATGETPEDVGLMGENTFRLVWAQQSGHYNPTTILRKLGSWFQKLNIAARVRLRRVGESIYYVGLEDPRTGIEVNLIDSGFGASQVLPIIVQGVHAGEGSTMLIEQPELHLHPRGQATLGDFFIELIGGGITIVAETHSEHLIARLQTRIAEKILSKDQITILYCLPTKAGTEVRELKLNDNGQFIGNGIPQGFFDERYEETLAQYHAIASRMTDNG